MSRPVGLRNACVIGYPVRHSRSPLIHNHWLAKMGLEGTYTKREVAPEDLHDFISTLRERGFAGCNVTIPHKEAAFSLVRVNDEPTRRLGVVNTIFFSEGQALGTNTDGHGFTANLAQQLPRLQFADRSVLLLGSGGAARAIAAALLDMKVERIMIANRTAGRAEQLHHAFGSRVVVVPWQGKEGLLTETDLLVNSTSLGMHGEPELALSLARLPMASAVCDIVYVPLETALLRQARQRGNPVVDGLGMLLHQAQPGFEKWFGVRPEVTIELRRLIEADIAREMKAGTGSP